MLKHKLFLVSVVASLTASTGYAHDLVVLADPYTPKSGQKTTVRLSWGHGLGSDQPVEADAVERYELLAPSGVRVPLTKPGLSAQANAVELREQGVYQVTAARKAAVLTYVLDSQGRRQMKRGPKTAIKEGTVDYSMRSQQFAKAVIVAGSATARAVKPAGLPLEIVPLDGPAAWRSRSALRFQVLFDGKPLAHELLLATCAGFKPENAWCYAIDTDKEGVATVEASRGGIWVLRVGLRKLTSGTLRDQYDYDSYTATVSLEIQP